MTNDHCDRCDRCDGRITPAGPPLCEDCLAAIRRHHGIGT